MADPWRSLRVVEVAAGIAGRVAGGLLGDLGAEVTRVLPVTDRPLERAPAAPIWDRSVRRRRLDLGATEGRAALAALLEQADVALLNLSPATLDRLDLGAGRLTARHPALIHCT